MSAYYGDPESERVFIYDNKDAAEYIRADLVPQWQPIETAPKDGEWVILWSYSRCVISFYSAKENEWLSDYQDYTEDYKNESPTHWQPLPTPPPAT